MHTTALLIDRIIEELGYAHLLGNDVNAQLDAYKSLRTQGLPRTKGNLAASSTVAQARKDVAGGVKRGRWSRAVCLG